MRQEERIRNEIQAIVNFSLVWIKIKFAHHHGSRTGTCDDRAIAIRFERGLPCQAGFERFGMDRYRARQQAQTLIGGPSSNLPLNIGFADVVPLLGTGLQTQEAVRMGEDAISSAQQGMYGTAALQAGGAALGLMPGVGGTVKVAKSLLPKARFEKLVDQYSKLKDTQGGRILNTDDARELSDEYRNNRSLSSSVQEFASKFIDQLYDKKLSSSTPQGFDSRVLILGGGGGSGKTSGRKKMGEISDKSEIIYDTTLSNLETAQSKVEKALEAGRDVVIAYTARDPIEAFYGVLQRAMKQEKELGSGRTIPLEVFARQHPNARENIEKLAQIYADNPSVKIIGIDNTLGAGNAKVVPVAELPKFDYNGFEEKVYEILKQERQAGHISESIYTGTLQDYRPQQRGSQDRTGALRQSESDGSGATPNTSPAQEINRGRSAPQLGAE